MISTSLVKEKRFLSSFKKIPVNWVDEHLDTKFSVLSHKIEEPGVAQGMSHAGWEHNTKPVHFCVRWTWLDELEGNFLA